MRVIWLYARRSVNFGVLSTVSIHNHERRDPLQENQLRLTKLRGLRRGVFFQFGRGGWGRVEKGKERGGADLG